MRRGTGSGVVEESVRLHLSYRPPLAWAELLRFLADRALAGVEWVSGLYAAVAAVAASRVVRNGGPGELVDLSIAEVANTTGTKAYCAADDGVVRTQAAGTITLVASYNACLGLNPMNN